MLKEIFDAFRKENQLHQAFERSCEMLKVDRDMFLAAISSLRDHNDARIDLDIYASDQMINAYEREVRRKVLTHMALSTSRSISAGLALVSIADDVLFVVPRAGRELPLEACEEPGASSAATCSQSP